MKVKSWEGVVKDLEHEGDEKGEQPNKLQKTISEWEE